MARTCRIVVDLLGAELPANILVDGAIGVADRHPTCEISFICNRDELKPNVQDRYSVVHCTEWVREQDSLRDILLERRSSSMHIGMRMLAERSADGFVSVGNTGALMALGCRFLKTLHGIDRPAMIKEFDGWRQPFWMLDLGANIVRKPTTLYQFAVLGSAYASRVRGVCSPRVALMNIGVEERKGPTLLRDAAILLDQAKEVNFVGFVEPNRMFDGTADVVVTDGYVGNIALKAVEGTVNFIREIFFHELAEDKDGDVSQLVRKRARKRFRRLMKKLDSQRHNGASFVGLNGVVVKSHNSTTQAGMTAAIEQAIREVKLRVPSKIQQCCK